MRAAIALALLLVACREEPRERMFELGRAKVRRPDHQTVCPGTAERIAHCPQFRTEDFPRRVELPRVVHRVEPQYAAEARRRGITGVVILQIGIRRDGSVGGICVAKPLPCGLSDAAADAVRQWRFEPRQDNVVTTVTLHFPPEPSTTF